MVVLRDDASTELMGRVETRVDEMEQKLSDPDCWPRLPDHGRVQCMVGDLDEIPPVRIGCQCAHGIQACV